MDAANGTHILIHQPSNCDSDIYFNCKAIYNINIQGYIHSY